MLVNAQNHVNNARSIHMKKLIKFTLVWISENLAMPFWVVGHIHLSLNVYHDLVEIATSLGLNIIVFIGFLIDFNDYRKQ